MKWEFPSIVGGGLPRKFNNFERPFWVVWCPGWGEPWRRHDLCKEAREEARRLAEANPGRELVVLRADSSFVVEAATATHYG